MTCNPFTSITFKNSPRIFKLEDIPLKSWEYISDFENSATNRFNRIKLNSLTNQFNSIINLTDLRNHKILDERKKQAPINNEELAEYMEYAGLTIDQMLDIIETETQRRKTVLGLDTIGRGAISSIKIVNYPKDNPPDILEKVKGYNETNQRKIIGRCKGTVSAQGYFEGTIYETENAFLRFGDSELVGECTGIENVDGRFRMEGIVTDLVEDDTKNPKFIPIEGDLIGLTNYEPGFVIFDAELTASRSDFGNGASFNVVIGPGGTPIISISTPGINYNQGDTLFIGDTGIEVKITEVGDVVLQPQAASDNIIDRIKDVTGGNTTPDTVRKITDEIIKGSGGGGGANPVAPNSSGGDSPSPSINNLVTTSINAPLPVSDFKDTNYVIDVAGTFAPAQDFTDVVTGFGNFLDENFGAAITEGIIGKISSSILSGFLKALSMLSDFAWIFPNLLNNIWNPEIVFPRSLPGALEGLVKSFLQIIEQVMNQARQTVDNLRTSVSGMGQAIHAVSKNFGNMQVFFEKENMQEVQNVSASITQKMWDQVDVQDGRTIAWIQNRLGHLSNELVKFTRLPLDEYNQLLSSVKSSEGLLKNISNIEVANSTTAGALRTSPQQLRLQARNAQNRSNQRSTAGRLGPQSQRGDVPTAPARPKVLAPSISGITEEELGQVIANVTENGWPGFFSFAPSVLNNNYAPTWGERMPGAGWRIMRDHVPMTMYRVKQVIEEVGGGPYTFNSCFRSHEYNVNRTNAGTGNRSRHLLGCAIDISGAQAVVGFKEAAEAYGFTEIIRYGSFMHIALPRDHGLRT